LLPEKQHLVATKVTADEFIGNGKHKVGETSQ